MSSTFALPSILHYKRQDLRHDAVAALVLMAITIPQSLAFAVVVGLPPVTGLYTALLAPIVFALFASTRRLVVGADSATAGYQAGIDARAKNPAGTHDQAVRRTDGINPSRLPEPRQPGGR